MTTPGSASITRDEGRRMVVIVRDLLDHGSLLADLGFLAWLASETPEVVRVKQ